MEPAIPQRSKFWFRNYFENSGNIRIFDSVTIGYSLFLAFASFAILWPIISKIKFEEAFFTPLAPFLIYLLSFLKIGANDAMRVLFMISFMVSTVGVYLLARELTKRQVVPILAALIYLLPPVPVFVLTFLRRGLFEVELSYARSFFSAIYGDGAHFLALAIIPFAILFFLRYLKSDSKGDLLAMVVCAALILLANRSQSVSLFLILAVCTLSEVFLNNPLAKIKRLGLVVALSIGLVSFWYTPDFWVKSSELFFTQLGHNIKFLFPLPFTLALIAFLLSVVFFAKRENRQPIFVFFLLFVVFFVVTFDWLLNQHSYIAHPYRLLPNLNMFAAIVGALTVSAIFDKLRLTQRFSFESWPAFFRVLGALSFGILSFVVLSVAAKVIYPYVILGLSGPGGLWIKISQSIANDRAADLLAAGANFQLVGNQDLSRWWFGLVLSVVFLILLILFSTQKSRIKTETSLSGALGFKEA